MNGSTDKIVIGASSITKRFGDVLAVDGVSFEVRRGETYGLLGPNGAGKTTTMRMVSGLSPPHRRENWTVAGIDVSRQAREVRNVLGVVTQQDGLDTDLNARDNLITYGFIAGLSRAEAEQRADAVLMYFDLTDKAKEEIDNLSGGMKRRLAIARAFMTRPQVIVLDEPTTGLDPQGRNGVWQELETMKQAGVTVLMSTHYMDEARGPVRPARHHAPRKDPHGGSAGRACRPARRIRGGAGARFQWRASRRGGLDREGRFSSTGRPARSSPSRPATGYVPICPAWREYGSPTVPSKTSRTSSSPWRAGS